VVEHRDLYQRRALYYDIAFARDVSREVQFLAALYERHAARSLGSVLELGCGPGYHARAFAKRGVRALGLDLSGAMLALACERATAEGTAAEWLRGDMREFTLARPVDLAICMLDGIDSLITDDDVARHFECVSRNLAPRGLYVIELSHPRDCAPEVYGNIHYEGERDGYRVAIDWGTNTPVRRSGSGPANVQVTTRVWRDGDQDVFVDEAWESFLTADDVARLARRSAALGVVGWYGDFDLGCPFDDGPASRRLIAVLQKRDA
jgi:SAM-dependent methyltransferase